MSTAYCYVTDGHDDAEMRRWSMAALRRYCGQVDVFTVVPSAARYAPFPGERVIDLSPGFSEVFGDVSPLGRCRGSRFPRVVFGKFALPYVKELEQYDRIVSIEADLEVVSPAFAGLDAIDFPDDNDIGLVTRSGRSSFDSIARQLRDIAVLGSPYYSVGLVLLHGGRRPGVYLDRVREMLSVSEFRGFRFPEEYAANIFMSIMRLPDAYQVIPYIEGINSGGSTDLSGAYSLHYGGPRKARVRDRWKRQFETGGTIDLSDITGSGGVKHE